MELEKIVKQFKVNGNQITYLDKYGEGIINATYLLIMDNKDKYIVQKINNHVFPNVDKLMNNISLVLDYLRNNAQLDDPSREAMRIIKTNNNENYYHDVDTDSYYRIYDFVSRSVTLQKIENAELFKESAIGFARFALQLKDFDASQLYEVIPNFHNTKSRFEHFKKTLTIDPVNRSKNCQKEIDFVLAREKYASIVVDKIKDGSIPLRVTHNDTKLNNILLDEDTLKSLCVIDLDTIMPGSLLYDFGDSIRFGCNPAGEMEQDLSKVNFNLDYFKAYVEGYLSEAGQIMSEEEIKLLPYGAILMTYECGVRFLDDYLDGDHYFRIKSSEDNLIRCRTQFKLVKDMEELLPQMNSIINKIISR